MSPLDALPRTREYLATLPDGLDSYPDAQVKGSLGRIQVCNLALHLTNGSVTQEDLVVGLEQFVSRSLRPAIHARTAPLRVSIFRPDGAVPLADARAADYTPIETGHRWGPAWSTAWFKLEGSVPSEFAGEAVALRFSSGTEALLWQNGAPRRGFDEHREACTLFETAAGGETVEFFVEAACNY